MLLLDVLPQEMSAEDTFNMLTDQLSCSIGAQAQELPTPMPFGFGRRMLAEENCRHRGWTIT
jgi:hypothetical protein